VPLKSAALTTGIIAWVREQASLSRWDFDM